MIRAADARRRSCCGDQYLVVRSVKPDGWPLEERSRNGAEAVRGDREKDWQPGAIRRCWPSFSRPPDSRPVAANRPHWTMSATGGPFRLLLPEAKTERRRASARSLSRCRRALRFGCRVLLAGTEQLTIPLRRLAD